MLIIEGLDGVGKTTLVNYFQSEGMKKLHFDYDSKNIDLLLKYLMVLKSTNAKSLILDRSFISEMVYGPVMRKMCKLSLDDYIYLLKKYDSIGTKVVYLIAPKEVLLERRKNDNQDYEMLEKKYDELNNEYNNVIVYSSKFINITTFDTSENNEYELQQKVKKLVLK